MQLDEIGLILRRAGFRKAERTHGATGRWGMTEGYSVRRSDKFLRIDHTPATACPYIDETTEQLSRNISLSNYRRVIEAAGFKVDVIDKGLVRYLQVSKKQRK